jgi:prepilin peptidase CpaA
MMEPLHPIFGVLLAIACASDVAERRIPNALVATFALAGVVAQWLSGGAPAALGAVLGGTALFALLFLPWAAGKMGGGDLKLAVATALWLGPSHLVAFVTFAAMAGIPVALAARVMHTIDRWQLARSTVNAGCSPDALSLPRATAPLAVAIAAGAIAALHWRVP